MINFFLGGLNTLILIFLAWYIISDNGDSKIEEIKHKLVKRVKNTINKIYKLIWH